MMEAIVDIAGKAPEDLGRRRLASPEAPADHVANTAAPGGTFRKALAAWIVRL